MMLVLAVVVVQGSEPRGVGVASTSATVRQTLEAESWDDISTQYVPASSPEHDLIGASYSRTSCKNTPSSAFLSLFSYCQCLT